MVSKALVLRAPGELCLDEITMPDGVRRARMRASGICGTDKHAITGSLRLATPMVLGHENVGEIDGKRYTWATILPCNRCAACLRGMPNVCERDRLFGLTIPDTGGWSEYTPVPDDTVLFEVPNSLDDETAVLVETMASTKALRQVDLAGKDVLIIGSGPIGLLSAVHARAVNARTIAITGHRVQAERIGAVIDEFYEKNLPVEHLATAPDVVLDAGGNEESLGYCIDAVKPRGVILESGCMVKGVRCDVSSLVKKELRLYTQLGYEPVDFAWAIDLVVRHAAVLNRVITHRFALEQFADAVDVLRRGAHGKVMFVPC